MTNLREAAQMALDAATEELPKVDERETVFCSIQGHHLRALCEFVRAALAQPEPEPVAYRCPDWSGRNNYTYWEPDDRPSHSDGTPAGEPLYTAPPQREWVGLTEDEAAELTYASIQEIEDALRKKNT